MSQRIQYESIAPIAFVETDRRITDISFEQEAIFHPVGGVDKDPKAFANL